MLDEKKLNSFILKRFLWTLIIIGIIQIVSNLLFTYVVAPLLSDMMGVDLFQGANFGDGILIIVELFVARITSIGFASGLIRIFESIQGSSVNQIGLKTFVLQTTDGGGWQSAGYSVVVLCLIFILLAIWILPYVIGAITFAVSVSKRVKVLEMQRLMKDRENEKQKNLLLSDLAHDIKTPITTIAGFSQALAQGTVEPGKEQEYLDAIQQKSMQTVEMVTLLFDYVRLDSAGYRLHKKQEDLCEIFRECVAKAFTDFEEKHMELNLSIPEENILMPVDKLQLSRAFHNLLSNACKHNEEGTTIWISIEKTKSRILCKVSDNGAFIEPETAKHLFDPFVQGDKSRTSGKGTGLGLSITRKIVEMHGGKVRLIQYKKQDPYTKTFEIEFMTRG